MELPNLGKYCQESSCQQLDFLPIKCQFCSNTFCTRHFLPQDHQCSGDYSRLKLQVSDVNYRYPCQHPGCKSGELAPVICPGCSNNFCLAHRHQIDHGCAAHKPPENSMAEAAVKIQKITESLDSTPAKGGQGRKSDKLSAKVQLMKLKQKSSGDQSLPQEERVYLMILLPQSYNATQQPIFVSRHWTVGKAIDVAANIAKVKNDNNILGADKLMFFHERDGSLLGSMDQTLKSLLDDQQMYNGQTVILEYIHGSA
ncbi:hypothetical protein OTU49_006056 [Cherax quadricarinatus]|uniref:AN1-type domain-containing protein n=1 Tax=Cherax quadricarinatus TaxID=27406 RepID=A0AAW0WRE1_CHEQU|nr:AN1-type zinc finger protein 1-like [Cherax quadricarinatus]